MIRGVDIVLRVEREHAADDAPALQSAIRAALAAEGLDYSDGTWDAEYEAVLRRARGLAYPLPDEAGACEVAHDLIEEGRVDDAKALLDEQAPNRHGRKCPACGAYPGTACTDLAPWSGMVMYRPTLLVPHSGRLR